MRVYLPYGQDWYGYLVRRLAERPANLAFFLRSLASHAARPLGRPGLRRSARLDVIAILGAGKMGEALLSGMLRAGASPTGVIAAVRRR